MKTELISYRHFDSYAKRIETITLKKYQRCWSWVTLQGAANILEIQTDNELLVIEGDWREKIKEKANLLPE